MPLRLSILALAVLASGCLGTAPSGPARSGGRGDEAPPPDYDPVRLERLTLAAANDARIARGLAPLQPDAALTRAARLHSDDLARYGHFSHTGSDGSVAADRAERVGARYQALGENLYQSSLYASGYTRRRPDGLEVTHYDWLAPEALARQAVQAWLDSPGHRANLLNPRFGRAGTGVARGGGLNWVVTMLHAD